MTRELEFTKMEGLGNDYIYVDCLDSAPENPSMLAKRLTDRHFGIGGDGLVLILPSRACDFRMRMFNRDGSEAAMCGNAVRCVGKYLFDRGRTDQTRITVETESGDKELELLIEEGRVDSVRVNLGIPVLEADKIPVAHKKDRVIAEPVVIENRVLDLTCVSMGNPHAVFFVDCITDEMVLVFGPKIETHALFPQRTNVAFARVINPSEIEMRVWERGCGETLACGTGAAAVAVAASLNGLAGRKVTAHLKGGDLEIEWADNNKVYQTGPARFVFDGVVYITP